MKKIFILISFISAASTTLIAQKQRLVLSDDFTLNKNEWPTYVGSAVSYLIYNGKLIVGSEDSLSYNVLIPVNLNTNGNYSISITSTHTNGTDNYGYGMIFGASDVNNYFNFTISANGSFRVARYSQLQSTELVKWTISPTINKGNYVDNTLQLSKEGSNWNFFINGKPVASIPAMVFIGNKIGVTKSKSQRIEFDDLKIVEY